MNFSLNETTLLNAVQGGGIFSVINSIISPGYGIYFNDGTGKALSPSSFLGIEYGADASVVSAPIESGSYSSYNKVKRPPVIRVLFVLEGWSGLTGSLPNLTNFSLTSRADMLASLDAMVANTNTYDIETPDTTYEKYDLVRYNYRTSERDVTLLTVEAIFQSVLEEAQVTLSNSTAENDSTKNETCMAASVNSEKVPATVTDANQTSVSSALTGLKNSVSSAATSVADKVSSAATSITGGATTAINGAATSAIDKLSNTVTELVKAIT